MHAAKELPAVAPEVPALLKIVFSPHLERETRTALAEMARSLPFSVEEWPFCRPPQVRKKALS